MYVARINKSGQLRYSKPCSACAKAIKKFGIKKVIYSTGDGLIIIKGSELKEDVLSSGHKAMMAGQF